jgi:copper chaperone CopZ
MYSLITLMVLRQASKPFHDQLDVLVEQTASLPFAFILQLVILPVLSSACCGIQLAINALVGAGGCAGFNKYLGPLRPYFLALLFFATATSVPYHQSRNVMIRWIGYSVLRWFVALMPEMVYLWNVRAVAAGNITRKRRAEHNGEADTLVTTIEMTIPTMGCVACINKIDASMRRCAPDQIKEAKSWLEPSKQGGRALVRAVASTKEEADRLAQTLVNAVRDAGFQTCALDSIQIEHGSD